MGCVAAGRFLPIHPTNERKGLTWVDAEAVAEAAAVVVAVAEAAEVAEAAAVAAEAADRVVAEATAVAAEADETASRAAAPMPDPV